MFEGGPVEPDALIALALANQPVVDADRRALAGGRPGRLRRSVDRPGVRRRRRERGAGVPRLRRVGPGQLDGEIDAGAWLVLDADPDDVFTDHPAELWRTVLRRQGGRLAWLADAPDDLSAN